MNDHCLREIKLVRQWLEKVIIGLNLCPFAQVPYSENRVRFAVCSDTSEHLQTKFLWDEVDLLNQKTVGEIETSLIIFPHWQDDFLGFYDFASEFEAILEEQDLSQHFQIVAFHPQFYFDQTDPNDVANWVNRSPLPLIHILRASSLSQLNLSEREGERISFENERKLKSLSAAKWSELFGEMGPKK